MPGHRPAVSLDAANGMDLVGTWRMSPKEVEDALAAEECT
jgi:hypothetical protein